MTSCNAEKMKTKIVFSSQYPTLFCNPLPPPHISVERCCNGEENQTEWQLCVFYVTNICGTACNLDYSITQSCLMTKFHLFGIGNCSSSTNKTHPPGPQQTLLCCKPKAPAFIYTPDLSDLVSLD